MVLYFKVDAKNNVWLLWSSSMRISDKHLKTFIPLNLAPKFTSPEGSLKNTFTADQPPIAQARSNVYNSDISEFICPNCNAAVTCSHSLPLERLVNYFKEVSKLPKKRNSISAGAVGGGVVSSYSFPESGARSPSPTNSSPKNETSSPETSPSAKRWASSKVLSVDNILALYDYLDELHYEVKSYFMDSKEAFEFTIPDYLLNEDSVSTEIALLKSMFNLDPVEDKYGRFAMPSTQVSKVELTFDRMFERLQGKLNSYGIYNYHPKVTARTQVTSALGTHDEEHNHEEDKHMFEKTPTKIVNNDQVPELLKKMLPDLTNDSYRLLKNEPLFLSRTIELCERCFLKFTERESITPSVRKEFNPTFSPYSQKHTRRARSAGPSRRPPALNLLEPNTASSLPYESQPFSPLFSEQSLDQARPIRRFNKLGVTPRPYSGSSSRNNIVIPYTPPKKSLDSPIAGSAYKHVKSKKAVKTTVALPSPVLKKPKTPKNKGYMDPLSF